MMRARPRAGYTLLLTLLAISAVGLLVVSLDVVTRASVLGISARRGVTQYDAAIVSGVSDAIDAWPPSWRTLSIGGTGAAAYRPNGQDVAVRVTREDTTSYRFDVSVLAANGTASVSRSVRAHRRYVRLPYTAALTTVGPVSITNNATLAGADFVPENGTLCAIAGSNVPNASGIAAVDIAQVQTAGWAATWVPGGAQVVTIPGMSPAALLDFGSLTVADLVDLANRAYPAGTVLGPESLPAGTAWRSTDAATICNNWGQPRAVDGCEGHFPIIYAAGAITLERGAVGQGILIADGPVTISDATFYGIIVTRTGGVSISGASRVAGQVVIADPAGVFSMTGGELRYSSCAAQRVNAGRVVSRPVLQWAIADLLIGRSLR